MQLESLVTSITLIPNLHQWAYLAGTNIIVAHRVHSWVKILISLCSGYVNSTIQQNE